MYIIFLFVYMVSLVKSKSKIIVGDDEKMS